MKIEQIERLVDESIQQIKMRKSFAESKLEREKYLILLSDLEDSNMSKDIEHLSHYHRGLVEFKWDKKAYKQDREQLARAVHERERPGKYNEVNILYLRGIILNGRVEFEEKLALTPKEKLERYAVVCNRKIWHRGYSTAMEFDDLVTRNAKMVEFLKGLETRNPDNKYSLFFRWNQYDPAKTGEKSDIIRPLLTCPGATEQEVREIIMPYESREKKPVGIPL